MLSFSSIIKQIHLCDGGAIEHMRIGAQKRAKLEKTPQKVAHLLMESVFVDTINSSDADLFGWCRRKHQIFTNKYSTISTDPLSCEIFEHMFCRVQRAYYGFARLARIWRLRTSPVQISCDLFMTPLDPSHKHTFKLLQQNNIYYFSTRDLCKLVTNSITNSAFLFSEPKVAKNPYNNIVFNKADLYNMYWKIRESVCVVPTIIDLWFRYGFDVYKLRKNHEHEFADYAINNYVNALNVVQMCEEIYEMIYSLHFQEVIQPNPTFSSERFAADFKPYLRLFLKVQYYPDKIVAANLRRELICKLRWFSNMYPYYGKIQTHSPPIQQEETEVFMRSHQYSEAQYTNYIMWGKYDEIQRNAVPRLILTLTSQQEQGQEEEEDQGQEEQGQEEEEETILSEVETDIDEDYFDP